VILAVKPQNVKSVFASMKGTLAPDAVLISIVAGLPMEELQRLSGCAAVVRTMPNTPAMIGQGMTVWCATDAVDKQQEARVQRILTAMGHEIHVENEE
jgi:pyrroline-5-carboxylate reductase